MTSKASEADGEQGFEGDTEVNGILQKWDMHSIRSVREQRLVTSCDLVAVEQFFNCFVNVNWQLVCAKAYIHVLCAHCWQASIQHRGSLCCICSDEDFSDSFFYVASFDFILL